MTKLPPADAGSSEAPAPAKADTPKRWSWRRQRSNDGLPRHRRAPRRRDDCAHSRVIEERRGAGWRYRRRTAGSRNGVLRREAQRRHPSFWWIASPLWLANLMSAGPRHRCRMRGAATPVFPALARRPWSWFLTKSVTESCLTMRMARSNSVIKAGLLHQEIATTADRVDFVTAGIRAATQVVFSARHQPPDLKPLVDGSFLSATGKRFRSVERNLARSRNDLSRISGEKGAGEATRW